MLCGVAASARAAQDWIEAYGRGVYALQQGQAGRAVLSLQQAIRLHPQPEDRVVIERGGRREHYWPYLRLGQALVLARSPEAAREALSASQRWGIEPQAERERLREAIETLEAARARRRPGTGSRAEAPAGRETVPAGATAGVSEPEVAALTPEPAVSAALPPPAATEPAPQSGTLEIFSEPAGAAVYLDDEFVGNTDPRGGHLVKSGVAPGTHQVRMSAADRNDFRGSVDVAAGQSSEVRGSLSEPPHPRRGVGFVLAIVLAGAIAVWLWRRRSEPEVAPASATAGPAPRAAGAATPRPTTRPGGLTPPRSPTPARSEATSRAADRTPDPPTLGSADTVAGPTARPPTVGERFGAYRLVAALGRGGMASVYKAERDGELYALKRPLLAHLEDPGFLQRFLREAEIGRTLHHPNIVRIYERGEVEGVPYFTMELVAGETLQERVRREGGFSARDAARVISQVAEALDYAHLKGVIHRDLKPSNIMLLEDGTVKVMDYGIARARRYEGQGLTTTGVFLGTPDYVAPETAEGRGSDARSDLYSLGVVLYELLTARKPFVGNTPFETLKKHCSEPPTPPSNFVPGLPPALEAMVLRLMSKDPAQRYPNAEELLIELRDYLNG